jgi:DNA-binding SARP family transcriptional activator
MFAYMRALLDRAAPHLSGREAASWKRRVDDLAGQSAKAQAAAADSRIRLSMLGTVQALTPDGRVQRFQGARARMVLAMMVINETLDKPMSQAEFCRLAAGGEVVEIESARDIVKTTVHRIRELIGRDAVLTEGAAPRLNPELVEIDIVEARALLDRSAEAMRRSSPMQAKGALTSALDIMRGEVPFPSLYDDVIEAAREDIETLLRSTVIDVARALAREGAIDDAAEVLRRSVDAIPGDEEIKELLRETLLRGGRRAEAERIRRMVESE